MAVRGKIGRLCQALLIAASMSALASAAHAQQANELNDLSGRVLDNPNDVQLAMQYADAALAAGKPRLALAAYEQILINDPSNEEARRGYERVRRMIEPAYTVTRVQVGARFDSNAANLNEWFFGDTPDSTTYFGKLMVADERELGGRRWRSILNATYEDNDEFDFLNYGFLGVQTGPIFYAGPHLAVIPSIGLGAATLDDELYYTEANLNLTLEGRAAGMSYWVMGRYGYREYEPDDLFFGKPADNGPYAELLAGITKPGLLLERDTLTVQPYVRWNSVDGDTFGFAPGSYTEYGADVNYNYQVADHVKVSVGALFREREFDGFDRTDNYTAPQASVTLQRVLPCDCDIQLQYRYRDNESNFDFWSYDAEQTTLSLTARF